MFAPFHEAWTEENDSPHDHLAMDTAFMEPMCVSSVLLRRVDGVWVVFFSILSTQARPERLRPTRE